MEIDRRKFFTSGGGAAATCALTPPPLLVPYAAVAHLPSVCVFLCMRLCVLVFVFSLCVLLIFGTPGQSLNPDERLWLHFCFWINESFFYNRIVRNVVKQAQRTGP